MKNKIINISFASVQAILWILIVTKTNYLVTNIMCFCTIVLCFLFSLLSLKNTFENKIISFALFFTMCADFCLVIIKPQARELSMVFFLIVQLAYFSLLLLKETRKQRIIHIIVRVAVILVAVIVAVIILKNKTDYLSIISIIYFANLLLNFIFSFLQAKENIILIIGFLCFICCDILVGLSVADGLYINIAEGSFLYSIIHTKFNVVWTFYIISQTLIALFTRKKSSLIKENNKKN